MKTFTFPIPDDLRELLDAESGKTGAPLAEITRRALRAYLVPTANSIRMDQSIDDGRHPAKAVQ